MNKAKPCITIFTTRTGGGHMNLAQALKETLNPYYDIAIVDPYPDILRRYYSALSRYFLRSWDIQYRYTDNKPLAYLLHLYMILTIGRRIQHAIEHLKPQLIISTHALLSYEIARVNGRMQNKIPLVFQLTDLERVHIAWFTEKHAAAYLAPSREIAAQALENGIEAKRLYITGRPVRHQFLQSSAFSAAETLTALGLEPDVFTIFLQGGAQGSAGIDRIVKNILMAAVPMQLIMAVGNNTGLAHHFANIKGLKVLAFTSEIAPYMAASDVIVGKAGASFLTEAIFLEKPCIITTYIPGQEAPNLRFLEHYNLGWVCLEEEKQIQLLTQLASQPAMMAQKIASIREYKAWNIQANQAIPAIIEALLPTEVR